ncbi:EAL domain-containing protein [uncultured Treponema sp.]|uniref:EAL domain-containing protein n=1 Tax=uncultured Treponema sp. TaxID=162155 RepID=UPI0025F68399|nr:EAL domain-containing protein [uncultured Treponema sp.]
MEKYRYTEHEFSLMENSCIPFAVYQFIDNRVVALVISAGFMEIFDFHDRAEVYSVMDNDMYRDCHPEDVARISEVAVRFAVKDEPYDVIYRSKVKGKYRIIHAYGKHIYKNDVRLAVVWYFDEGDYNEEETGNVGLLTSSYSNLLRKSNIYNEANYDYLTGLPSITYFFKIAESEYDRIKADGDTPVMLFFDLNGMKFFNTKYGFAEGNSLIRGFSKLLASHFSNDNCCRFGMDRFSVCTYERNLEQRLKKLFEETERINNGRSLTVRTGIYCSNHEKVDVSVACDRAMMACDSNMQNYRSSFTYFNETMLHKSEMKQYIIDNLDRAIEEKWLKVYYQPIVRAANGRVCDEEALSRWIEPVKGFLNPADFIPILEDANLIYKLDLFVTEQILEKMKRQAEKGLYIVPTSVNLSRSDFDTCDIVAEIQKRVEKAQIPPEKLTIEITESVIGSDYDYMKSQVERFQSLGFKVWMDDFGSGYSSLDVLQDFNFDLIKFDMKFMRQFENGLKAKIILTELIRMAIGLGIDTVVEGVETAEQVEFLREVGCTKIQGFFYCKPIPAEQVFERYDKGIQIGFENPEESEYFAILGKINLNDLSVLANGSGEIFKNFFNTLPMAVLEYDNEQLRIIRGNRTYREFIKTYFKPIRNEKNERIAQKLENNGSAFLEAIRNCMKNNDSIVIEERLKAGIKFHVYIRRIAVNPVTSVSAFVVVVLSVSGNIPS